MGTFFEMTPGVNQNQQRFPPNRRRPTPARAHSCVSLSPFLLNCFLGLPPLRSSVSPQGLERMNFLLGSTNAQRAVLSSPAESRKRCWLRQIIRRHKELSLSLSARRDGRTEIHFACFTLVSWFLIRGGRRFLRKLFAGSSSRKCLRFLILLAPLWKVLSLKCPFFAFLITKPLRKDCETLSWVEEATALSQEGVKRFSTRSGDLETVYFATVIVRGRGYMKTESENGRGRWRRGKARFGSFAFGHNRVCRKNGPFSREELRAPSKETRGFFLQKE